MTKGEIVIGMTAIAFILVVVMSFDSKKIREWVCFSLFMFMLMVVPVLVVIYYASTFDFNYDVFYEKNGCREELYVERRFASDRPAYEYKNTEGLPTYYKTVCNH